MACRLELAADLDAAKRLRADLHVDGIPWTDSAVQAAARDWSADVATLGFPLTSTELNALDRSAIYLDRESPIRLWVNVGEPRRFGGFWVDPPGSGRLVVAILNSDHRALTIARCLDNGVDVRYVAASQSVADENALVARISADMSDLRSKGTAIQSVGIGVRASVMVVIVGVTGVTDAIRSDLVKRYGNVIVVEEQSPITPA